jgi:RNA polymerase sigma-70 factor (sigma-E family)
MKVGAVGETSDAPGTDDRYLSGRQRGTFDALFRDHYAQMARLGGLLLGDFTAGEDVAQEAFARLHDRLQRHTDVENPAAYLRTTVVNLSRSRLRRLALARRRESMIVPARPVDHTGRIETERVVRAALAHLPRRQREAAVLRFYNDLSYAEIAEVMRIDIGAVKAHLHRAVSTLTRHLEEMK